MLADVDSPSLSMVLDAIMRKNSSNENCDEDASSLQRLENIGERKLDIAEFK
ncbi:hypothetical protein FRC11_013658 [Ceratobasidium sp. 423]|nr:hypothetical protein FRC11_013658 [Ceratobasidium sp. 423]